MIAMFPNEEAAKVSSQDMELEVRWLSAQLGQLMWSIILQSVVLSAPHSLGGAWGPHWSPQFVNIRALNSMVDSAPVGYSKIGVT